MSQISSILALTDEIESLIGNGQWNEAAEREAERRRLLVQYVEAEGSAAPHLKELQERNLNALENVRRLRSSVAGDASQLIRKSQAVDAYLVNAGAGSSGRDL